MKHVFAACAVAGSALLAISSANAQVTYSPTEAAMVRGYVLSPAKVTSYISANNAIKRDASSNSALAREARHDDSAISLSAVFARAKASPLTMAYYHKAGLSDADAVLLPVAVADAAIAISVPASVKEFPASPAQIAFVKSHAAEVKAFMASGQ